MAKKIGVVRFLGTNCDRDIWQAVEEAGLTPEWLWHADQYDLAEYSGVIIPGGFSYGDYLRCGALASRAQVMKSVYEFAQKGGPVLGICNGFQILCETGLLPGALMQNNSLRFIDKWVDLKMVHQCQSWGGSLQDSFRLPIAHGEGRYYVEDNELKMLQDEGLVWLEYSQNPNGSVNDIAGVMNSGKNVAGLMPHPERALFDWMGGQDGCQFFETLA